MGKKRPKRWGDGSAPEERLGQVHFHRRAVPLASGGGEERGCLGPPLPEGFALGQPDSSPAFPLSPWLPTAA